MSPHTYPFVWKTVEQAGDVGHQVCEIVTNVLSSLGYERIHHNKPFERDSQYHILCAYYMRNSVNTSSHLEVNVRLCTTDPFKLDEIASILQYNKKIVDMTKLMCKKYPDKGASIKVKNYLVTNICSEVAQRDNTATDMTIFLGRSMFGNVALTTAALWRFMDVLKKSGVEFVRRSQGSYGKELVCQFCAPFLRDAFCDVFLSIIRSMNVEGMVSIDTTCASKILVVKYPAMVEA